MKKLFIFISIILIFIGCVNEDSIEKAMLYSIDEIRNSPDFHWYHWEYDSYNYNSNIVDSIVEHFDKSELKIIIFIAPSCFCGSLYTKFPQLIKVLDSANIPANNYEIYVTKNIEQKLKFEHPYSNFFEIYTLPSLYLLNSDMKYYRLMLQVNNENISIEEALLEGLKFFKY